MRRTFSIIFISLALSCTSTKEINQSPDTNPERGKPPFSLPVCLNFASNPPHDSIVKRIEKFFDDRNVRLITQDQMLDLVQTQMQTLAQTTTIRSGSSPEAILSQIEKKTAYVSNFVRIEFSFTEKNSQLFKIRWCNDPMPMQLTNHSKPEWIEINASVAKESVWPESLRKVIDYIIFSGKLQ